MAENAQSFDAFRLPGESAKRDLDATAWAIALAAPGLFAGLGQVDKLFMASRLPWAFGYVFGLMMLLLLLSIYLGLKNYTRLHSLLGMYTSHAGTRLIREQYQDRVRHEWTKNPPDIAKIEQLDAQIKSAFDASDEQMNLIGVLHGPPGHKYSLAQRNLLEYAYLLFILILLTSDFSKLVKW